MIIDHLDQYRTYLPLNDLLEVGFGFLRRTDLAELPDGRQEIQGDDVFALVGRAGGRGRAASPLEAHRRYIDIQFCVSGCDVIGYRPAGLCQPEVAGYDSGKDIVFFVDKPDSWLAVPAGHFAVFFPADAHAPLAGEEAVHKVIVKVRA